MEKKFFIRISRFSDRNWKSYALPEGAEWKEYMSLNEMKEAGATQRDGLCGLRWHKPYVELDDVVIPAGHPMRCDDSPEDVTCAMLVADGFFVRVYVGEEIEEIQDGVIFRPGCTEKEAEEIIWEWSELCITAEEIIENGGLIDVNWNIRHPYDDWAWNRKEGAPLGLNPYSLFPF